MPESVIEIKRVGLKGQGVGSDGDGNIYFVERTLPGDEVRVAYDEGARRYRDGVVTEIVRPSSHRVSSVCPYFLECGGCDWLTWDYESQLLAKDAVVTHALQKVSVVADKRLPIKAAKVNLGYRTRVQLRYESGKMGFYRRRSHELVDIKTCAVAHPKINEAIAGLRKEIPPGRGKVEVGIRKNGEVHCDWNKEHAYGGFTQVNEEQNEFLRDRLAQILKNSQRVLELFCGDGNLTSDYYEACEEVIAVEESSFAIAMANARGLKNVSFFQDRVDRRLLKRLPAEFLKKCDTVLLDPPRQGLFTEIDNLMPPSVQKIVYVSCNPAELAKTAGHLKALKFGLSSLECIDMFPQTRHVESVAVFRKSLVN